MPPPKSRAPKESFVAPRCEETDSEGDSDSGGEGLIDEPDWGQQLEEAHGGKGNGAAELAEATAKLSIKHKSTGGGGAGGDDVDCNDDSGSESGDCGSDDEDDWARLQLEEAENERGLVMLARYEEDQKMAAEQAAREEEERLGPVETARRRAATKRRCEEARERFSVLMPFPPRTADEAWLLPHIPPGCISMERFVGEINSNPGLHTYDRHKGERTKLEHIPHWRGTNKLNRCRYSYHTVFSINHDTCFCKFNRNKILPPLIDRLSR